MTINLTLIDKYFGKIIVSTQVLGELYNVFIRKGFKTRQEAKEILLETIVTFPIVEISITNISSLRLFYIGFNR
jgi:predicted nucleic acid-binding protein